jgi:hypothetical protein
MMPRFYLLKAMGGSRAEFVTSMAVDADWGSLIAGYDVGGSAAEYDGFVMKLDSCGSVLWSMSYGGAMTLHRINAIVGLPDGTSAFVGESIASPSSMTSDIIYGRLDSSTGKLLSAISFAPSGGTGGDSARSALWIEQQEAILIVGKSMTGSRSVGLIFLVRLDGSIVWSKAVGQATSQLTYHYDSNNAIQFSNGDIMTVASVTSTAREVSYGLFTRLDCYSGDVLLATTLRSAITNECVKAWSISRCRSGGYVVLATTTICPNEGGGRLVLVKFSAQNVLEWARLINSAAMRVVLPKRILCTRDGGYIIVGSVSSTVMTDRGVVLRVSEKGAIEWAKTFGKGGYWKDYISDAAELPGELGGYRLVGHGYSYRAGGSLDAFIAQIESNGILNNHPAITDVTSDLSVSDVGNIIVVSAVTEEAVSDVDLDSQIANLAVFSSNRAEKTFAVPPVCNKRNSQFTQWPTYSPSLQVTQRPSSSSPTTTQPSETPSTSMPSSALPTAMPSAPTTKPTPLPSISAGNPTPKPT